MLSDFRSIAAVLDDSSKVLHNKRLDIATLSATGALAIIAACALNQVYRPDDNLLGPTGTQIAKVILDAGGLASAALFLAGFTLLAQVMLGRDWWTIARRAGGWVIFIASFATAADLTDATLIGKRLSIYGNGGSIGASLRFTLDDAIGSLASAFTITLCVVVSLSWIAPKQMRFLARHMRSFVIAFSRVLMRFVASARPLVIKIAKVIRKQRVAQELVPLTPVVPTQDKPVVPISTPAELPVITTAPIANETIAISQAITPPVVAPPIQRAVVQVPEVSTEPRDYELPSLSLLSDPDPFPAGDHEQKLRDRAAQLEKSFQEFGLVVKVVGIHTGPVITQYEVSLDTGLRLNKVTTLSDDLALKLGVASVRIVAPLPGRNTVGIEVPNDHRQTVRLKELILATQAKAAKCKLPIFLGKDVEGRPLVYDMADMPHLLIAGRTGTGKSVCLNTVLQSFLLTRKPDECRLILIDPKQVEFNDYGRIPHLMHPVVTKNQKAEAILGWAVDKMEDRYDLLRRARVRNIAAFNELGWDEILRRVDPQNEDERRELPRKLPYIVIVIDEVGDLLMEMKKEVESHIIRLAQKSRAAGIHLILATQRPTVDVITGLIKSNLPARICFQVASRADSAVVLDEKGAEKLLGMGDMLFLQPRTSSIIRGQGAYVDDKEIERVTAALETDEPNYESELLNLESKSKEGGGGGDSVEKLRQRDPLYEQAIDIVIREQRGSTSLLQRALGVGYGRASRLIDFMAEDGIVGGYNGSNARDVLLTAEEWESRKSGV